jgi:hypothetical protein
MSFQHLCARYVRESAARWHIAAWLIGCCAGVGCTPLGNLDQYASGGDPVTDPSLGGASGSGAGVAGSAPVDPGPGAGPAPSAADAGSASDERPALASDAASADSLALRITSSVPADGATGVRRDTSLSIAFSQPMDRASVEAAFGSDSLPAAAPEFHWDSAGMLLNIVLGAPLSYAAGDDPSQVSALRYDYRISALAHDLAGHALPESHVSFATLREIHVGLSALGDPNLTGNWRSDGTYGTDSCAQAGTNLCVGDSSFGPNAGYRGFVSFDPSALAVSRAELTRADFSIQVVSVLGNPFGGLGPLELEPASFAAIGPDAYLAPASAASGNVAAALAGAVLSIDVRAAVQAALTSGERAQFRLLFQSQSDGDGVTDLLFTSRASATLQVVYLVP